MSFSFLKSHSSLDLKWLNWSAKVLSLTILSLIKLLLNKKNDNWAKLRCLKEKIICFACQTKLVARQTDFCLLFVLKKYEHVTSFMKFLASKSSYIHILDILLRKNLKNHLKQRNSINIYDKNSAQSLLWLSCFSQFQTINSCHGSSTNIENCNQTTSICVKTISKLKSKLVWFLSDLKLHPNGFLVTKLLSFGRSKE